MKKIAFLTSEFITPNESRTGGLGTYIWNQAKLLSDKDIEVVIYQPSSRNREIYYLEGKILFKEFELPSFRPTVFQVIIHFFIKRLRKYSFVHYLKLKFDAKNISNFLNEDLKDTPVDLIQYVNLNGLGLYLISNCPSIIRISSITDLYNEFGKGYYGLKPEIIQAQIKIENETYKKAICIVGPSSFSLNKIITKAFQLKLRLPTPIGLKIIKAESRSPESVLRIGYFGSIDYRKGVDLLIDALVEINIPAFRLYLCGKLYVDGEENINIKNRVLSESFIHYSDSLPKDDLFELMKEMDLIILPSRVDNCPNTLLESLAMGKIVIGPNAWGFEELISDGVNGILFECGSLSSLVEAIKRFKDLSEIKKNEIEENAFLTSKEYSGVLIGDDILAIYQECILHFNKVCAES